VVTGGAVFKVIYINIDKRESMLPRENFMNGWVKPKMEGGNASQQKMAPDPSPAEQMWDLIDEEMEGISTDEVNVTTGDGGKSAVRNVESWTFKPMKLPVFEFQKYGIGVAKRKRRPNQM
jgi:hypothetical protein